MQDMREAIHDLVVNQLGVKKADYLGHSLGGQFVMGYGLSWPDAVGALILEAPAGLEEYPREVAIAPGKKGRLFDESFARDFGKWKSVWDQEGLRMLSNERNKAEQDVLDMFYFKKRDKETGALSPTPFGYFNSNSEYAKLHTDQR